MFLVHNPTAVTGKRAADFLSLVHPLHLRANRVDVAFFYLKNATREAIKAYHDAGIGVVLIHEAGASDGLKGAVKGAEHGRLAGLQALALGAPADVPIVFASAGDFDNNAKTVPLTAAYWRAAKKACWPYLAGCYADHDLLDEVGDESALNVQAAAKGWSWDWVARKWKGPHRTAHLAQQPSTQIAPTPTAGFPGTRVDFCDIVRPFRAWHANVPTPVKPAALVVPKSSLKYTIPAIRSSDVLALRKILRFFGWMKATPSNVFDRDTRAGVIAMQRVLKVTPDGWYGPRTRDAMTAFLAALKKL